MIGILLPMTALGLMLQQPFNTLRTKPLIAPGTGTRAVVPLTMVGGFAEDLEKVGGFAEDLEKVGAGFAEDLENKITEAAEKKIKEVEGLVETSTSLGACGWPNGCLVLSSVRGLQMNVCRINGARRLVERSHECPRRSDQTISMHTRRPYRVWMGLSPSIELNNANGKSVHMPRRIAQSPNG